MLGDDAPAIIFPGEICGVELKDTPEEDLTIFFDVRQTQRSISRTYDI